MLMKFKDFALISIQIWDLEEKVISELITLVYHFFLNEKARTQVDK